VWSSERVFGDHIEQQPALTLGRSTMTDNADGPEDHFGFTKLIVDDLERCSSFYQRVFGLTELARVDDAIAGEGISEIMFNPTGDGAASLVLLKYTDRRPPPRGEVILGFITPDLEVLVARATEAGGTVVQDVRNAPEHGVKVAFVTDVEGHLVEVVELLA
jgi:predicted enzyme related to lactoylglutathione lyase